MTGQGWATGSDIRSRGYSHIPDEDWDRIFGKKGNDDMPQMSEEEFQKRMKLPVPTPAEIVARPSPYLEIINNGNN